MRFTDQQLAVIDRRDGSLLVDAGAGSGKTRVLAERFARAIEEDGLSAGELLTITFTDKAAAELKQRIRERLAQGPHPSAARETETAWISTIHGFCARVLRAHALSAGIDPQFKVLETADADALVRSAFSYALAQSARTPAGAALIAAHRAGDLRDAVYSTYEELRSRGVAPQLPALPAQAQGPEAGAAALACAQIVRERAAAVARHLGAISDPGKAISGALQMLDGVAALLDGAPRWPSDLETLKLPRTAKALKEPVCDEFRESVIELGQSLAVSHASIVHEALGELLIAFGDRYEELKRERSALDFEDLQLLALRLLRRPEIGEIYRARFKRVMVDEAQDTNRVQTELIDAVADGNLFMVGDAQQSIYGFRHADVELFRERGRELERRGARLQLTRNFRSAPELLKTLNLAFAAELGADYNALDPGLSSDGAAGPLVELVTVSKAIELDAEGGPARWRVAEAKALAARIAQLIHSEGVGAGEVVVLTRASTDVQSYERAIAEHGIATYVVGGRGYWEQPQVVQLVRYLQALCNRHDADAWHATLLSPLCGLSLDGLVLYAAGAADELSGADAQRLAAFMAIYDAQRLQTSSIGAEQLLHDVIAVTGYDLQIAALPGGRRRLASVRKLLRLAREHEARQGPDLRSFLDLIALRSGGREREAEAPLAGEGIDAVRLMTIHASKGLEFPVVCVADLGREYRFSWPMVRLGVRDEALGLRVRYPGYPDAIRTLFYDELMNESYERDRAEERRLFYVAMTRAQKRLILSGAAHLDAPERNVAAPVGWIAPALQDLPGVKADVISDVSELEEWVRRAGSHESTAAAAAPAAATAAETASVAAAPGDAPPLKRAAPVASLSYSGLSTYEHCHLRFYASYVIGLPRSDDTASTTRGSDIHALLAAIDVARPRLPPDTPPEIAGAVGALLASDTFTRIQRADVVRREQQFAFQAQGLLITGVFDLLLQARDGSHLEVIDYKSDRLGEKSPQQLTDARYTVQRLVYGLAALGTGAPEVTLTYVYLEAPDAVVSQPLTAADLPRLRGELAAKAAPLLEHDFTVTDAPNQITCAGCPARGTLCPHPYEATLAGPSDRWKY